MNINELEFRMFEIYAKDYKIAKLENNIEKIRRLEGKMSKISEELTNYIIEICKLDLEYKEYMVKTLKIVQKSNENNLCKNTVKYIKDTTWEGYWKKCSGTDLETFLFYLAYPIMYSSSKEYIKYDKDLRILYKNDTGKTKLTYGVHCAQYINKKYF